MFYLIYGITTIIFLILQGLASVQYFFYGITPDFLLILIIFLAVNYGRTTGGLTGFLIGFLQDLFSGGLFGINAISKAIVGYLVGFLKNNIYRDKLLLPPLVTLLATVVNQLLVVFFATYLVASLTLQEILQMVIIPLALCNSALSVIIYPILYKLGGSSSERKSERE